MKRTLTHLTMNTGDTRESARAEVADDVIAALAPLVRAGGGPVPNLPPYTVAITREDGAAAFTLSHPEYGPLVTCVLCVDDARANYAWKHCEKLYLKIVDDLVHACLPMPESVMQLPPRPEDTPWLAVILTGAALVIPTDAMRWAGDFERCMAWTILATDQIDLDI